VAFSPLNTKYFVVMVTTSAYIDGLRKSHSRVQGLCLASLAELLTIIVTIIMTIIVWLQQALRRTVASSGIVCAVHVDQLLGESIFCECARSPSLVLGVDLSPLRFGSFDICAFSSVVDKLRMMMLAGDIVRLVARRTHGTFCAGVLNGNFVCYPSPLGPVSPNLLHEIIFESALRDSRGYRARSTSPTLTGTTVVETSRKSASGLATPGVVALGRSVGQASIKRPKRRTNAHTATVAYRSGAAKAKYETRRCSMVPAPPMATPGGASVSLCGYVNVHRFIATSRLILISFRSAFLLPCLCLSALRLWPVFCRYLDFKQNYLLRAVFLDNATHHSAIMYGLLAFCTSSSENLDRCQP
jgi:hypothetical protein